MKKMTSYEIRNTWLTFFKKHNHLILASESLIPKNDKSLLWINSGVATLKNYFSGKENPPHKNLANSQKAIRTNDITNVGQTSRHHTFFEMLGNFSIGGYFKQQAIQLAYDLLILEYEIDINKLYITVFDEDQLTYDEWIKHGIPANRIIKCGKDRNFWDVGSGPCGPCTEIFYDRGSEFDPQNLGEKLFFEDLENDRYVEIWNIVFSQYNNDGNNNYTELSRKNIDTGAGLERLACISQKANTNFDTDLFMPIIETTNQFTSNKYDCNNYFNPTPSQTKINLYHKVIADHVRAAVFAIADGAIPYNKDRGYVLRKLIRRVIVMFHKLNINQNIFSDLVKIAISIISDHYDYLIAEQAKIIEILNREYVVFNKTLKKGLKIFEESVDQKTFDKNKLFKLVETYGFPFELIQELANEKNIELDVDGFNELFKKHQVISSSNNEKNALYIQNGELLKLDTDFEFVYKTDSLKANVLKLFDKDLQPVESLQNQEGYIVLDKSNFYATSGGQLHDFGTINKTIFVDDVFKGPNLQHIHHASQISLKTGDTVNLQIDLKNRELTRNNHSVEHLIHATLCLLVDPNIKQEGAFKSAKKVTFDFKHHERLSEDKLEEIENKINDVINQKIESEVLHLSLEEAKAIGAKAYFEDVYKKIKSKLRVVKMGDYSIELCGGTHVDNTYEIESFKIIDFYPKGSGSWRIEGITTNDTISEWTNNKITDINDELLDLKIKYQQLHKHNEALDKLFNYDIKNINLTELIKLHQEVKASFLSFKHECDKQTAINEIQLVKTNFASCSQSQNNIKSYIFENLTNKNIFNALNELINENSETIFMAFNIVDNEKIQYIFSTNVKNKINLNSYISELNKITDGRGGGKPNIVQGGCRFDQIDNVKKWIKQTINA